MNLRSLIERRIQEAQEEGKFRNLPNEGRRLDLTDNPFEDPEMRMAYKVLSNAGYPLPWMDLMKEVDAGVAVAEHVWEDYRVHRKRQMSSIHRGSVERFAETVAAIDNDRNRALTRLTKRWEDLNGKILRLNVEVPSDSLRRVPIRIERQRDRFETEFPLLGGLVGAGG